MYKIADSHCDLLAYRTLGGCEGRIHDQSSFFALLAGGVKLQNFAVWIPPEDEAGYNDTLYELDYFNEFLSEHSATVSLLTNKEGLNDTSEIKLVLSIESADSIDCKVERIEEMYNKGVRIFSLTWNYQNEFASGCLHEGGIKKKGYAAIEKLNSLRMALDVSHLNEEGFWDAAKAYKHPLCATHSCVYDICANPRNLKKEQISHIIESGGYIGINFFPEFLCGGEGKISDVLRHIEYILSLGGEDCAGLGADFCGIQYTPEGLESSADYQKLPEAMELRGYSKELIEKICYGNFERFIIKFL